MIKATVLGLALLGASPVLAQCGGDFGSFVDRLKSEATGAGLDPETVDAFFKTVRQDPKVLRADRAQGVFQKPFISFSDRLISQNRVDRGAAMEEKYSDVFDRIEAEYGVNRGVLLAFWAFETDYGGFQGDFNTRNALVTLAHDCRRPELFRPQIFAALELHARGDFDPERTKGAWAGEIGMVQMLPRDILVNGVDADGSGKVELATSAPDALVSGAKMLEHMGWQANEPWLQEVTVPDTLDWSLTGASKPRSVAEWQAMGVAAREGDLAAGDMQATIILPQGHKGPAFIAYPNFNVYFEWNQSFVYVLTAAYFATQLEGAPAYQRGTPEAGLNGAQMKQLQTKLQERGYDVGDVDGILGARTRAAVQTEQQRLGLPADAWPTPELLRQL
ncbi:lytic murein transglycosylase [Ruegeria jejuensis]|uniref:lytic murein transglycosylase n=1 Tax=Ruegeria jejuensis TaxID=3233338 RepID=UPI00355B4795